MNLRVLVLNLLFFLSCIGAAGELRQQGLDKRALYAAMESGTTADIDIQLNNLKASVATKKEAFEGALLMKKAGVVTKSKEKLHLFKLGRTKLESSISKETGNIEYRFLRIIIQEHAPKIVNYRNDVGKDSQLILANFKSLSPFLQQQIVDYSKKSKVLKTP